MIKNFIKPRPLYFCIDIALIQIAFFLSYFLKFNRYSGGSFAVDFSNLTQYLFIFILWSIFIIFALGAKNLHSTDRSLTVLDEFFSLGAAVGYASIIMSAVVFFAKYKFFSRQVFFTAFILVILLLGAFRVIKRLILRRLIRKGFHNINVLIIGSGKQAQDVVKEIQMLPFWGFKIVGFLNAAGDQLVEGIKRLGDIKDFSAVCRRHFVDEVIIACAGNEDAILHIIEEAKTLQVGVRLVPLSLDDEAVSLAYFGFIPLLSYGEKKYYISGLIIKRMLDIIGAILLIIGLSPLLILIAILIKYDSPGPVFYVRPRIGMKGRVFRFYKFRSMASDAEGKKEKLLDKNEVKDGVIFKIKKDPRITRVGKILRRFSLDELPQLFNVLKGDMSLVGPRPFPVEETARFQHIHMPRLNMRPGITGLPQVKGRSDLSFHQWIRWDLWYIKNWSFALDMRILLMTIPAVIKGKGAY